MTTTRRSERLSTHSQYILDCMKRGVVIIYERGFARRADTRATVTPSIDALERRGLVRLEIGGARYILTEKGLNA